MSRDLLIAATVKADSGDLSLEPVDELGALTASDEQPGLPEQGGADLDAGVKS
jgi:hypothetical protein